MLLLPASADIPPLPSPSPVTGRRLGALFFCYLAAAVALITLAPFQFARPTQFRVAWIVLDGGWATDVVLNVVLFAPLGLLWQRMTGARPLAVLGLALIAALAIEGAQLFLAPRYSTASDLVANGVGAWLGATLSEAAARRVDSTLLISRLWLDQPLMGLVWLLIPLAWLVGLSSASDPARLWLLVPIGAAAALGIAAVAVVTQPGVGRAEPGVVLPFAASLLWAAIAIVPSVRVAPWLALGAVATTGLVVMLGGRLWRLALQRERRLEPQVVRVLVPLLLLVLAGLSREGGSLDLRGGGEAAREGLLHLLAVFAAFTLLGYLVAESRGRRRESLGRAIIWPMTIALLVGALLRVVTMDVLATPQLLASGFAAGVGAVLYDAQRAHIIALLAGR